MNKLLITQPVTIVANGDFPRHSIPIKILNDSKCIIACDGAADILIQKEYDVNYIIGDIDSLSKTNIIKYRDKIIKIENQSENDLRKAISKLYNQGIKKINIIAATGKREDHTLGNIFSIYQYKDDLEASIFTDFGVFKCINKDATLKSFKGQQVSFFTNDNTIKITSNGLMYNFNYNTISTLFYGTLNQSTSNEVNVNLSHGKLLVFQEYKENQLL